MMRDRLHVVLQVRELVERRRLAERAVAERALADANRSHAAALLAREDASIPPRGTIGAAALAAHRSGGLAAGERAELMAGNAHLAAREVERTERRRVEAAIDRRSVERLQERRTSAAAVRASRLAEKQLDDIALQTWRRHA